MPCGTLSADKEPQRSPAGALRQRRAFPVGGWFRPAGAGTVLRAALSAVLIASIGASIAVAEQMCHRQWGEMWIISTRHIGCCCTRHIAVDELPVYRIDGTGGWQSATWDELHSACNADQPICWFVHGNRTSAEDAVAEAAELGAVIWGDGDANVRLVLWSWPSDRAAVRHVSDARIKAARCDLEGRLLAASLRRLGPRAPLCFVGYSFGARIVCDALDRWVSSGQLPHSSSGEAVAWGPYRAVLVAAAMDCDWILPGGRAAEAFRPLESAVVTRNCADPVLKWYSLIYGFCGPQALGRTGVPPLSDAELAARVRTLDVTCEVGREHGWGQYLRSPALVAHLKRYARFTSVGHRSAPLVNAR